MKTFRICVTLPKYEYYEVLAESAEQAKEIFADDNKYFIESSDGGIENIEVIEEDGV